MFKEITPLSRLAFSLFGKRLKEKRDAYIDLEKGLRRARIPMSFDMYMATVYLCSIVVGIVGAIFGLILSKIIIDFIGMPEKFTKLRINENLWWIIEYRELFLTLFLVSFGAVILGTFTYLFLYSYPSIKASERKGNINKILPHAVTFMYSLSRGGANIIQIFQSLASHEETYEEVAREAQSVMRYMDYFGYDLRNALLKVSEDTPSDSFRELIDGLLTVIDSGGDITRFFGEKADEYLRIAKIEQKGFLETLGLLSESYVTAFVAGPLFIIIIEVVMTLMGSGQMMALYAIIYMVIPIGSIAFVVMINMISPSEMTRAPVLQTDAECEPEEEETIVWYHEMELYERFKKSKRMQSMMEILRDPLKAIKEEPLRALYISAPAGIMFLLITIFSNLYEIRRNPVFLDDYIVFTVFIVVTPLSVFYEMKRRKDKKIKNLIPGFLKEMASMNATGMTISQSIEMLARGGMGILTNEIKKIWKDIEWGMSIKDAFVRFANRIKMASLSRTVTLLAETMKTSGDITDMLYLSSKDAEMAQELEKERFTNMLIYVIIIYISFLVFIGIIYIISFSFLPVMAEAAAGVAGTGGMGSGFFRGFDIEVFHQIFLHAALIQGFCSGLIAGQMGEGEVLAGLKHALIMLTISYLAFAIFI
ncbi:MAG: type II secretion system F family protein [Candidatus Syntropharchaeia archaeon]